jgi:hypothetical protein
MTAGDETPRRRPASRRRTALGSIYEATDDMITFVERYQQVWAAESRAMLALGEFLGARAESLRLQVELMRMGSDTFRRYTSWSEALLGLRPEALFQSWLAQIERGRDEVRETNEKQ